MRILFLQRNYNLGGVNVVTATLANRLAAIGYKVSIFVFDDCIRGAEHLISESITQYVGVGYDRLHIRNVNLLRDVINKEKPDLILNNWALNPHFISTIRYALKLSVCRPQVWSEYHSAPNRNSQVARCDTLLAGNPGNGKRRAVLLKRKWMQRMAQNVLRYTYRHSDGFIVLSPSYIETFCQYIGVQPSEKVWCQINPLTVQSDGFVLNPTAKKKEILYVGRLDPDNKKVSRMLDVWQLLNNRFPDWSLTILGDGPERPILEKRVMVEHLPNVHIEGRKDPTEYYKRASIIGLCSDFEGFPLVLGEAMTFGCVPVAYGSVSSIYDIITHGKDGLIQPANVGFLPQKMAEDMASLVASPNRLYAMMNEAKKKSEQFSLDAIIKQWQDKFEEKIIKKSHAGE